MNFFELFGQPVQVDIDLELLDIKYYQLIAHAHPDALTLPKTSNHGVPNNVSAEQINMAYNILKNEDDRLKHLLDIKGFNDDIQVDDVDFLMKFLQYQETLDNLKVSSNNYQKLNDLKKLIVDERSKLVDQIKSAISKELYDSAQVGVAKLNFYRRILQHISQKEELLDEAI